MTFSGYFHFKFISSNFYPEKCTETLGFLYQVHQFLGLEKNGNGNNWTSCKNHFEIRKGTLYRIIRFQIFHEWYQLKDLFWSHVSYLDGQVWYVDCAVALPILWLLGLTNVLAGSDGSSLTIGGLNLARVTNVLLLK